MLKIDVCQVMHTILGQQGKMAIKANVKESIIAHVFKLSNRYSETVSEDAIYHYRE